MQAPDIEQHGRVAHHTGKKRLRVYQQWHGNERFFCWGYLVGGPNWKASLGTAFLIAAPAGILLAFVAPYMGLEVHIILLVISCVLPVLAVWFLMLTACRDPGIIPRQEPDQEYLSGQKPRTKDVYVNNQRVGIRYNDTCHFYQPPRAHHCSVNDNCIERFDHHCPWVGTTIGARNYRTFLLFVYTSTVLCLYAFGLSLAMLFVKHNELVEDARAAGRETGGLWGKSLTKSAAALALMGYTFLFFWFVGGLSAFHAYLVATNQTTYENFRYNHDNRPNPYSRGVLRNCAEVWCLPVPPSKVKFRAYVDEFQPPTGQPTSPYVMTNGPDGGSAQEEQPQGENGGGAGGPYGASIPPNDLAALSGQYQQHPHPSHQQQPPPQQQYQQYHQQPAGALGGGGSGYGMQHGGGMYDPASLQPVGPMGLQHMGLPAPMAAALAQQLGGEEGTNSRTYSDAGAGWGLGPEPPAQVKQHLTFTSQSGGYAGSPLGHSGYGGVGAPHSQGGGGHSGHGYGSAQSVSAHVQQPAQQQQQEYYDDEYDEGEEVYDEDDDEDYDEEDGRHDGQGQHPHQHQGREHREHQAYGTAAPNGGGVVLPEHVRPAVMR